MKTTCKVDGRTFKLTKRELGEPMCCILCDFQRDGVCEAPNSWCRDADKFLEDLGLNVHTYWKEVIEL